ncbi:MAG: polysaccharide deacetylase family protein, partial [Peptococcaceae bacterium]|nr:polysaccharide deacetylase family protein [Peptococcaceae bacterium]
MPPADQSETPSEAPNEEPDEEPNTSTEVPNESNDLIENTEGAGSTETGENTENTENNEGTTDTAPGTQDNPFGIDPSKPMVALTFDDGPSQYTWPIVTALQEHNARATF